jgi:hypothetical protein
MQPDEQPSQAHHNRESEARRGQMLCFETLASVSSDLRRYTDVVNHDSHTCLRQAIQTLVTVAYSVLQSQYLQRFLYVKLPRPSVDLMKGFRSFGSVLRMRSLQLSFLTIVEVLKLKRHSLSRTVIRLYETGNGRWAHSIWDRLLLESTGMSVHNLMWSRF